MKVAVIGGGITGLTTAWFLRSQGHGEHEVTVYEASDRTGGKIRTSAFRGRPVDEGPDAFITRTPDGVALAEALGLGDQMIAPAAGHASLWTRGRLRPLPPNVLGLPTDLVALARSGILPLPAVARAAMDLVLPRTPVLGDPAVADVVGARLGRAAAIGLVDPLLGGIHAGHTDQLSIEAVAPQVAAAARRHRSLVLGLRGDQRQAAATRSPSAGPPASVFVTPREGVGVLVDRLTSELAGCIEHRQVATLERTLRPGPPVGGMTAQSSPGGDGWLVDGRAFDAVVLAVPAPVAAGLIGHTSPTATAELRSIRHSSVTLLTLAYPAAAVERERVRGSGFLVPRPEGRLMTACTFGSNKWPHWSGPEAFVFRVSAGRTGDERVFDLSDGRLVDAVHAELEEAVGVSARPLDARISRWPDAFAQYEPGHMAKVDRIEWALSTDMPGVAVAGAAYRGVGIPACVASAERAAAAVTTGGR